MDSQDCRHPLPPRAVSAYGCTCRGRHGFFLSLVAVRSFSISIAAVHRKIQYFTPSTRQLQRSVPPWSHHHSHGHTTIAALPWSNHRSHTATVRPPQPYCHSHTTLSILPWPYFHCHARTGRAEQPCCQSRNCHGPTTSAILPRPYHHSHTAHSYAIRP